MTAAAGHASREAKTAVPDLTGSALLLCAHGRSGGGEGAPEAHAAALRDRRLFARVETCALRGRPALADVLAGIEADRTFLVPLLMADGHTNRVVLPEMLAKAGDRAGRATLCRPVGLSPALAALAASEAAMLCSTRGWRPAETAIVIAGHGTARHERSGASAELLARRVAALGQFASVAAAFLDQAPAVAETLRARRPFPCAVVGFFLDAGSHSVRDIPRLIAAEHPDAAYTGALGVHSNFVEIILATVREAARSR